MSAYKQFTTKDVTITPFWANKGFSYQGADVTSSGIQYYYGLELQSGSKLIYDPVGKWKKNDPSAYVASNGYDVILSANAYSAPTSPLYYSASLYVTGFDYTGSTKLNIFNVYNSVKQLYYSNFQTRSFGDLVTTRSFYPNLTGNPEENVSYGLPQSPQYDNFRMSTLPATRSWVGSPENVQVASPLQTASIYSPNIPAVAVISIPSKLYGEAIEPGSFNLTYSTSVSLSVIGVHQEYHVHLKDDAEGNIIGSLNCVPVGPGFHQSWNTGSYENKIIGNIIYPHGTIIVSDAAVSDVSSSKFISPGLFAYSSSADQENNKYATASIATILGLTPSFTVNGLYPGVVYFYGGTTKNRSLNDRSNVINFSSSLRLYEHQYNCSIKQNELGYSLNPTLLSGSNGKNNLVYHDFATGSYFSPYITTVGLYNNKKELVAVGKLSKATKMPMESDLTIQVNFDI